MSWLVAKSLITNSPIVRQFETRDGAVAWFFIIRLQNKLWVNDAEHWPQARVGIYEWAFNDWIEITREVLEENPQ